MHLNRIRIILLSFFLFIQCFSLSAEIKVAVFDGARPVSYKNEDGHVTGIYPEVLREIFSRQNEDVTFVTGLSFHDAYEMVLSGEIDLMPAFIKTAERQELFEFSKEVFLVSWSQLFIHPDNSVDNILDLKNQKIALMEGGQNGKNFVTLMESFDVPFRAVYYKNFVEMTEAVLSGEVMGMVSFSSFAQSEHRIKASSIIFSPTQSYTAVRKGGPVHLLETIDNALLMMKNEDDSVYQRELNKLSMADTIEVIPFWVIILISFISVSAVTVFLFMMFLRIRVRQVRDRLEESEAGYSRLFDSARELISIISYSDETKCKIIDVNSAFCEKTGYTKDELTSMTIDEFMSGDFGMHLKAIQDILEYEDYTLIEAAYPTRDGGSFPIQISVQVFERAGEKNILTIARDLSERDKFNTALGAVQQKYSTIADYNYDWEFWLDENGQFIYNSPSCKRISGYNAEEFLQDKNLLKSIISPSDKKKWEDHVCGDYSDSNDIKELEFKIMRKDGSPVWIHHQCRRIFNPKGIDLGVRGNFQDITEKKGMEEQLSQKQKLSSLGVLAGGIAHDFNNILAIIKGFSDIGKNSSEVNEEVKNIFETINQASVRGEHLTEQILDFSRNKIAETKPVQISSLLQEIYKLLKPSFPSSINIVLKIENNSFIMADPGQVHRTVMNLCTNARLAMPEGGELTFSVKELDIETISSRLTSFTSRRCMELMIKDTGVGMSEEVRTKAFDPYFTTRKTGEGSGMGLAVVHGLVQQWGGQIIIESSPGQGTAVFLYLPILDYNIEPVIEENFSEIESVPSKVLVIDDEPLILKLLNFYLEKGGYSVGSYSSANDALEEFRKNPDMYKLALMDMTMPEMQGDRLAHFLKEIRPELPVILCSGSAGELQKKIEDGSVDRILNKPFTEKEVLTLIAELL